MPDCQMCWNEWPTLVPVPIPQLPKFLEVCRNCDRGIKKIYSFSRAHGFDLATGEITVPQAGSQTLVSETIEAGGQPKLAAEVVDKPPDPPAQPARKKP